IRATGINNLQQITSHDDLLEWRMNNRYFNTRLPFNNLWNVQPNHIGAEAAMLAGRVAGASDNWRDVLLEVVEEASSVVLNGSTALVGDQLQFQVYGNSYRPSANYRIALFNQPRNHIDGAMVDVDLPWSVSAEPLFGLSPIRTLSVIPGNAITDRVTQFKVQGYQLQNADKVELGEAVLSADQYSVNTAGTEMTFSAVFATPGVKTLRVSQQDNAQVASMPAAVLVAQAIEIADITTNNVKGGEQALSDSGNNRITVQGLGLQGNLAVHLVPYDQGFIPDSSNLVRHRVQGGQLFIDNSPKVIAGRKYQLVIIRKETEETVFAPQQLLLTGVDDTAPVLLSGSSGHKALTMSEPLRLTFDEPVSAEGYQVIKQFKDYTDSSDVDISNRFELVNIAAQSISLRLLPGQLLDADATYRIVINGIADSAGDRKSVV